jgi:hypothetical protein
MFYFGLGVSSSRKLYFPTASLSVLLAAAAHVSSRDSLCLSSLCFKTTAFWDIAPCILVEIDRRFRGAYCLHHQGDESSYCLMMGAVRISETSVYFNETTWRCIPESCNLHSRRHENFKYHFLLAVD